MLARIAQARLAAHLSIHSSRLLMTHQPLRVLVGSLAPGVLPSTQPARLPAGTIMLDLGPEHPSHAGLIELRLWTEDDVITTARSS